MFYSYAVYYENELLGTVNALTEQSAIDKFFNQSKGVTRYSGPSYDKFEARRVL